MKKIFSSLIIAIFAVAMVAGTAHAAGTWDGDAVGTALGVETYAVQNTTKTQTSTQILLYSPAAGVDFTDNDTFSITVTGATYDANVAPGFYGLDTNASVGILTPMNQPAGGLAYLSDTTTNVLARCATDGADFTGLGAGNALAILTDNRGAVASPATAGDNILFDLTGLAFGGFVSVRLVSETVAELQIDDISANVIQGINQADVTQETPSAAVTIDVASEKKRVLDAGGNPVLATLAATYTVTDNKADIDDQNCDAEKIFYTISGNMAAVNTITGAGVTSCNAAGVVGTGPAAGNFWVDTANNKAYAVNTALLNDGVLALNDLVVTFDGTTVIAQGSYTIQATYLGEADVAAWTLDTTPFTFLTLAYNGTVVYPGIVIGSGYGYDGGFRIVNRGTSPANIYFQVQNHDGAMLAEVAYSGNPLAGGATVYVPTDTVLTEGGLTTTSSANGIITVEAQDVDIYQISYKSGGYTIVPLTKANNQVY